MTDAQFIRELEERYRNVCEDVARATRNAGRRPGSTQIVIASKTQPAGSIEVLIRLGHRTFGENRVQEAWSKWPELKRRYPDVRLHLIGPLQTNKVRDAVRLFDVIETVDRDRLAAALAVEEKKSNRRIRYMIEVNVGAETQKSGIAPAALPDLLRSCREVHGLLVDGLMCIPPADQQASPYFALLAKLAQENGLTSLSMGMSSDYKFAIQLGATHVRIGTAIFGARSPTV